MVRRRLEGRRRRRRVAVRRNIQADAAPSPHNRDVPPRRFGAVGGGDGESSTAGAKTTTTTTNVYRVLGADPSMSRSEIRKLYVELAKLHHPDSSSSSSSSSRTDEFDEIARAWEILSDERTRRAYDREMRAIEIKEGILRGADALAREYGPTVRGFYEDVAIPLLRRVLVGRTVS